MLIVEFTSMKADTWNNSAEAITGWVEVALVLS